MRIDKIFDKIGFVERYRILSSQYSSENYMEKYSPNTVLHIFNELGYAPEYFNKEKFFRVSNKINSHDVWFHIGVNRGLVELMLYIKDGNEFLKPCGPFSWIPDEIGQRQDVRIKPPSFSNYEELKNILKEGLIMFEDLKREFLDLLKSE
jgi:hypothetical protein